ncbi:MAG: amino acid adenylation domain-containing protein [Gemmatimonadaceae bacterium]
MDSQTTRAESELEKQRQRLLEQLLADEGLDAPSAAAIVPRDPSAPVPLTFAQEVLWLLDRATPGLTAYNTPLAKRVRGALDVAALERALSRVVERNEALRTVFRANGDAAEQVVLGESSVPLVMHDVSSLPYVDREDAALAALRDVANTPFDLTTEPGFRAAVARIAADDHILLLLTHHIVSDAWSYGLIFRELGELYDAELTGTRPDLPPVGLHFGDYAAWQRETLQGDVLESGLSFWRERLADLPVLELPTEHARPLAQGFAGARRSVAIPRRLYLGLRDLAQRTGTTMYMALLSAYATVLRQYTSQDDIIVGSAVAGRTNREMEAMVGYFSQALPMRVRFEGDPTVTELLGRVAETVLASFEHQDTPLEPIMLELQSGRAQSHAPLFRVVLTMQDTMGAELRLGEAEIEAVELDAAGTKFDLTLLVTERADDVDLTLWYRTDLFTSGYAERFLGHMRSVLEAMVANPAQRTSELSLLTPAEREKLSTWNATNVPEGAATTVTELFELQAARVPDRAAVVAPGDVGLSYSELNAGANKIARHLTSLGVSDGDPVGLNLDRSASAVIGLLGILKAGGCYVPLPPDLPAARRMQQLRESGAKVLLTMAAYAGDVPSDVIVVAFDRDAAALDAQSAENPAVAARPSSPAYVLFTSGSTGVPKGVAVTHANAAHYARAVSRVLGDVPAEMVGDGFAMLDGWHFGLASTLGADLGNTSLLPALLAGGTLHVLSKDVTTEPARYAEYVAARPLDVLKITPNHFMALVAGKQGGELSAVVPGRWIVFGGEMLRPDVARTVLGANRCRVLNHYGPTETTVGVLTFEVTSKSLDSALAMGAQSVPLGRPLSNTKVYVADASGRELPVGVPGELLIGGAGVAQGYLKRPDLTAEKFSVRSGERVYRTGDRVRRLSDGTIEFLGRGDDQVKVRGYRVELGEVGAALRAHPGVENGVVVFRDAHLVAYAVPKHDGYAVSHGDRPTPEKISEWLSAQLPEYMMPSAVVLLDTLPLTANGKIDRAKLPEPSSGEPEKPSFIEPRTPTEIQLATIWAEVLKRDQVGATDNFLALGGHSLLAIRLLGKISKAFGVRLPLRSLFESPTVEQIAAAVDKAVAEK